ncbi:MAG TPA: cobyrinate a,c-diamide synthase [Candidatus Binataceae bacterium]|nr:cobyrinate a,c-diamide synthase [Candidatus Binataceae bacterium]
MATLKVPRIVIAATGSGVGKTTVTVGLIAALRAQGLKVAPFKCGPDYLDPGYHARVAGRPSHNLDGWMMGRDGVRETFSRSAHGADLAIIEGMMGLFDSAAPTTDEGSTAEVAKWLDAPVLLVVDASGIARTIAAIAHGFAHFDPELRLAGLICNRIGGRGHLDLLRLASPAVSVVGGLPERREAAFPERHLGLLSANDDRVDASSFEKWRALCAEWLDLDEILRTAHPAAPLESAAPIAGAQDASARCRIGVAWDEAFHFYYEYNLARLETCGAEIIRFSPVHDHDLPAVDGLYFGGGYPEAYARTLSANRSMIEAVRNFAGAGGPIYAECGGLMYLCDGIRTLDGTTFPLAGLIPGVAAMNESLQAIGYAEVETLAPCFLGPAGIRWRGHQFRYSTLDPQPPDSVERIYRVTPRWGGAPFAEGLRRGSMVASYVHAHWASQPAVAENFVAACAAWRNGHRIRSKTRRELE